MKTTNKQLLLAVWLSVLVIFTAILIGKVGEYNERVQEREIKALVAEQMECLTKNIYYEAAGESFKGKLSVAQVVLNRTKDPRFPSDICSVIDQKVGGVWQFSWKGEKPHTKFDEVIWLECQTVAKIALTLPYANPELKTALFYHADYIQPGWKYKVVGKVGRHIFYTA